MIKVLRIINRFNLGGITYNVSYLSRYMPPEFETLLVGGPEEAGEQSSLYIPESLGLKPLVLEEMRRSVNPLSDYFAYRRLVKMIRTFKPDIVHTHASKAGAIGRLAAMRCGVPVIVHTFHGHVFKGYFGSLVTGVFKNIERFLARRSDAVVAISEIQKQELVNEYQICESSRVQVIPLGFDLARFSENQEIKRKNFRRQYNIQDNEIAIGIIGRLAPIKNHFLFIDAIEHVQKHTNKKIRALIIGDGETRSQLESYIVSKKLSWQGEQALFVFTSWIKEVDVALAGLDIVALSSKNEGTPVSLIEAQAASRFVVSTDVGGIRDILHTECGLLSAADDAATYCSNLLKAVEHFDELNKQAGIASKAVIAQFSYSRLCKDMSALYDTLLKKKKKIS
jgi:glycosyltransferase involved in cell wall biosynthesis